MLVAAIVILAIFLSFARGLFAALLIEVRRGAQAFRTQVLGRSSSFIDARLQSFWTARELEPRAPIVAELDRLNDAIETIGAPQVRTIVDAEKRLAAHLHALRSIEVPVGIDDSADRERVEESLGGASLLGLVLLVLFAVAIGAVNSFLLAIFFREVIGNYRIFSYPLPDVQASNLIALIIFFAEVATGWAIYRNGERRQPVNRPHSAGNGFFDITPWIMLGVLAIVELAAYSALSIRVNLAQRLGLAAGGPIYGLAQYFLSFLGVGLTLLLAYLGHAIAEGIADRRRSALARQLRSALRRGKSSALENAERIRDLLGSIKRVANEFPTSISDDFTRELGVAEHRAPVLAMVEQFMTTTITAPSRMIRTRTQVWGDLLVSSVIAVAILLVGALTALEVAALMLGGRTPTGQFIAWAAGIATSTTFVGLGVMLWSLTKGLRHAHPAGAALFERTGRRVLIWIVATSVLLATGLLVAMAMAANNTRLPAVFGMLAVLQAAALVCFSGLIDRAAVAIVHLLYLAWLALVQVAAIVAAAVATIVDGLCFALEVLVRLLAIPGDVLRGRLA